MVAPKRNRTAVFAGLVVTGLFASSGRDAAGWLAATVWPSAQGPSAVETAQLDDDCRRGLQQNAFNTALVDDLTAGRIDLAEAVPLFVTANADRRNYLEGIGAYFPAPTVQESVARCLVHRVTVAERASPEVRAAGRERLERQYAELFGRPFVRPQIATQPEGREPGQGDTMTG